MKVKLERSWWGLETVDGSDGGGEVMGEGEMEDTSLVAGFSN